MKFWVLAENSACTPAFGAEHGLSILAQCRGKTILFDTGKTGLFAENAAKLRLSLEEVDAAVLSHGHYDHAGGLPVFLAHNHHAPVWMQETALEPHFSHRPSGEIAPIGVPPLLIAQNRLHLLDGDAEIGEGLRIFAKVPGKTLWPQSNAVLLKQGEDGDYLPDDFSHEQHLWLEEDGKSVLLTGCSHCGVVNILESILGKTGQVPDVVIGGFHLSMPSAGKSEPPEVVDAVGEKLAALPCRYYTGHCTGTEAFSRLKAILGDRLQPITAGCCLNI